MKKLKILFVVSEDWYFCSHRLPVARAAVQAGYEVVVATRISNRRATIEEAGIRVISLKHMRRSSLNVFKELAALSELFAIFRKERPNLVHQVAIKPVLYGSLILKVTGLACRVNALGGLGFIFSSKQLLAGLIRPFFLRFFRLLLNEKSSVLILQNQDDFVLMTAKAGVQPQRVRLIRSAGVNLERYVSKPLPTGVPIVMLAARMIWDKGVGEFVTAACLLREHGVEARFVLVGEPDPENPSSVALEQLKNWTELEVVEWWGYREDMEEVLSLASIVCLPSYYGEGLPKVLIEAAACGRAIITTDMPGCRDAIEPNVSGLLVPARDAGALLHAIHSLIEDPIRLSKMGTLGRMLAEREFGVETVVAAHLRIYEELIQPNNL